MPDTYRVQDGTLKLADGSKHPPGSLLTREELTDRELDVFLDGDYLRPYDPSQDEQDLETQARQDERATIADQLRDTGLEQAAIVVEEGEVPDDAQASVQHDIPPNDDADEDGEGAGWRSDYHEAQAKASELGVDAQGTHEELVQRIETQLEETPE